MNGFKHYNCVHNVSWGVWVFEVMATSPINDIFMPSSNPPWTKRDSYIFFLLHLWRVETRVCCWIMKTLFVTAHSCRLTVRLKLHRRNYLWLRFSFFALQCTTFVDKWIKWTQFPRWIYFLHKGNQKKRALLQDLLKPFIKPGLVLICQTRIRMNYTCVICRQESTYLSL